MRFVSGAPSLRLGRPDLCTVSIQVKDSIASSGAAIILIANWDSALVCKLFCSVLGERVVVASREKERENHEAKSLSSRVCKQIASRRDGHLMRRTVLTRLCRRAGAAGAIAGADDHDYGRGPEDSE